MAGSFEPLLHLGAELLHGHAGQRRGGDLLEIAHRQLGHRFAISRQHGLERLDVLQCRRLRHHRRDAFQAKHHLGVHRMLDPERAVLVEHRDAVVRDHVVRAGAIDGGAHEAENRLLRGAVVPRRQQAVPRRRLRRCGDGKESSRQGRKHRQAREHGAPADAGASCDRFHGFAYWA